MSEQKKLSPRMTTEEIWDFVTNAHTGILTTLRRDGVPISMPLWFVCLDHRIYFRSRGKKLKRIANDPRSSFLVESGVRWVDLKAVHLTGRSEIVDLEPELAERFRHEMARKYAAAQAKGAEMPKASADHYRETMNGMIRFTPDDRILNWDNSKLSGA